MENNEIQKIVNELFGSIEKLIPFYMKIPEDKNISHGNLAVCIIDDDENIYGKMFGPSKTRLLHAYKIASTKATQVWFTGIRKIEYERMVFGREAENTNETKVLNLIDWEGGQHITLKSGEKFSVGFSGFSEKTDLEIITKAVNLYELSLINNNNNNNK